jgi:hypothetical protein
MDSSIEQNAFNRFKSPSTDEYKRYLLATVKDVIDKSPRITVKRVKSLMSTKYFVSAEDVDGALAALLNEYDCISSFKVPDRDTIHLNPKPSLVWDQRTTQQVQTA